MHHKLLQNALLKEEARAIVVEVEPELGELNDEEEFHIASLEDPGQCNSGESDGNKSERDTQSLVDSEVERPRLCQQRVPVEADGVLHSLHTLYDWGSTVTLVRRESVRRMGLRPIRKERRLVRGFEGSAVITDSCHYLPLLDAEGIYQRWRRSPPWPGPDCLHGREMCSCQFALTCPRWTQRPGPWSCLLGWTTHSGC
jgi:hypothetical protein